VGAIAVKQALRELVVKDITVKLRRLPAASHGTTIVQLTDLHVGPTIGRAFIEDVVRRTNALAPDIVPPRTASARSILRTVRRQRAH
jgi:predicted MPP superfamily phosphohydrolase